MDEWFEKNSIRSMFTLKEKTNYITTKMYHEEKTPYNQRTVNTLKFQCGVLHLRISGTKSQLIDRLERFDRGESTYEDCDLQCFPQGVAIKRPREEPEACFDNTPFPSTREDLPLDVWALIFSFLKNKSEFGTILDCRLLCKYLYRAATHVSLQYARELFGPDADIQSLSLLRVLTYPGYNDQRVHVNNVQYNYEYQFERSKGVMKPMAWWKAKNMVKWIAESFGCIGSFKIKYHIVQKRKSEIAAKRKKTEDMKEERLRELNLKAKRKKLDDIYFRKYPDWFLGLIPGGNRHALLKEFNTYLKTGETTEFVNTVLKKLE